ncbi:ATP-binding protein [uncultured Stenotrophomonas sp.]|uniref:ATP-binding protein n=1 Tax=uncultured Stenotrophomonas sp. TaxID=165438 RepID=UPI0028E7870E|nr:ATP-binding protein [uncultured Stenotrophomonas sp.]
MLLLAYLLAWPVAGNPIVVQIPTPRPLGIADGLLDPQVRAIAEDASGYLWLAGSDGLMRFDGQRFRQWRREEGLPDVDLRAIHVDARDRLWLGTANQGLVMMGTERSGFQRMSASAPIALRQGHLRQVSSSGDGRVWAIGSDQQLYGLSPRDGQWQRHPLPGAAVIALVRDRGGTVWVAQSSELWRWHGAHFVRVALPAAAAAPIASLWADAHGGIEVTSARGSWPVGSTTPTRGDVPGDRSVLRSADGTLWQQGSVGLHRREAGRVLPVSLVQPAGAASGPVVIRQAWEDRSGDLWWVSERHGLWWLSARWRQSTALPAAAEGVPGINSHYALALAASGPHHAWVAGSRGRLQRLDLRTGHGRDVGTYPHAGVTALPVGLDEDARGRVWLASADRLLRYDPQRGQRRVWPLDLHVPQGALSLQVCAEEQVWLAHPQAIQQWSPGGERLRDVAPQAVGLAEDLPVRQLLCTRDGELWATDPAGAMRWSPTRERFEPVRGDGTGATLALAEADDGTLWISRDAALEQYRRVHGTLQRLRRVGPAEGYPQLRAEALVVGRNGVAWAGAARGLVRVDPGAGEVTVLGTAQGLPVQEVLPHRLLRTGAGAVVAGMREGGLLAFDPRALRSPVSAPVLVFDAMSRRRHGRIIQVPLSMQPVILGTADRNLRVAIRLLGRGDPDRIRYRFRLLGHDPAWVDTGPVAQRLFTRLPAGDHTLLVQARHAGGPWSAVRQLPLRVLPRWWETTAGRSAVGVAICLAAVGLSRLHQRRQRRRARRRQARAREQRAEQDSLQRSRFLADLGSQVRAPLTPVLGWSELLLQSPLSPLQREQVVSLQQAGHHLLQLMDDALDLAGIESGRLQLQSVPFVLAELIRELHALLLPVARRKALALHWNSALDPDTRYIGDVQRLRQILLNLLGNALKFTAHGQVRLSARPTSDGCGLLLCVSDTGPGMTPAQVQRLFQRYSQVDAPTTWACHGGSGLGLAISRELARAMGGSLDVDSQRGRGTQFQLMLPWKPLPPGAAVTVSPCAPAPAKPLRIMLLVSPDEVEALEVVCAMLRAQGHRVVGVRDVDAWVHDVDPGPWDLIVADPDLLVAGGRLSARLPWLWPGVRRMALTARADGCAERDARAGGFDVFARLPLTCTRLAAALEVA